MTNHIIRLNDAVSSLSVRYSLAFNEGGRPSVGVRGVFGKTDCVIVDDIVWLIAGDVMYRNGTEINSVSEISKADISDMKVSVRAQAMVACNIVTVDLGIRNIVLRKDVTPESGILVLEKKN
jgi:hypothetical protein